MNRTTANFVALGFEMVAVVIGAILLGPAIDKQMGWDGTGLLVSGGFLFIGWITHFVFLIQQYMKDEAAKDEQPKN